MNILVFSESSWNDKDSFGNTLNNWFSNWNDNFSHFFIRKLSPNNDIASAYYNISTKDIIKGCFKFNIRGLYFTKENLSDISKKLIVENEKEQRTINQVHINNGKVLYYINDLVWLSNIWFNKNAKNFLDAVQPDIIFAMSKSAHILKPLLEYCEKKYNTKLVLFAADEMYEQYMKFPFFRRAYSCYYLKWALKRADLLYCASNKMAELYSDKYSLKPHVLTKGCDFKFEIRKTESFVIRLVYAGNMYYGRDQILLEIVRVINKRKLPIRVDIYTTCTDEGQLKLFDTYSSNALVHQWVPYEEVLLEMNNSDYVLVAESFEKKIVDEIKYSFSTKIIDALQSATGILAVGPIEDNTILTLEQIDGVVAITNYGDIETELVALVKNNNSRYENAKKIKSFAQSHYDLSIIRKELREDLLKLVDC